MAGVAFVKTLHDSVVPGITLFEPGDEGSESRVEGSAQVGNLFSYFLQAAVDRLNGCDSGRVICPLRSSKIGANCLLDLSQDCQHIGCLNFSQLIKVSEKHGRIDFASAGKSFK